MSVLGKAHEKLVFSRRSRVLSEKLAALLPANARVLDVGCGDGTIAVLIKGKRPDVTIEGIDVLVRPHAKIPVTKYDGVNIPFEDNSFDAVIFVDVLHHTDNPALMLKEANRVAKTAVILKDHLRNGFLAGSTLRVMDWVGNAHHGVRLPYNYWKKNQWDDAFVTLGLCAEHWDEKLGLYPAPATWLFDRGLHFVARLEAKA